MLHVHLGVIYPTELVVEKRERLSSSVQSGSYCTIFPPHRFILYETACSRLWFVTQFQPERTPHRFVHLRGCSSCTLSRQWFMPWLRFSNKLV